MAPKAGPSRTTRSKRITPRDASDLYGHADPPPPDFIDAVSPNVERQPTPDPEPDVTLPSNYPFNEDIAGPSSTFIPPQPSSPTSFHPASPPIDDMEAEDEVLAELPIYLSPSLFPQLNLFQYPLHHRPIAAPQWAVDRGKRITSRLKEKVGRVEIEVPVDAGPDVWRDDKARELGFVQDVGTNGDVEGGFGLQGKSESRKKKGVQKKWGEKVRLRSEVVPNATGYYSGIINDGALHLHPISKVLQFRTSLGYLDEQDTLSSGTAPSQPNGTTPKTTSRAPVRKIEDNENNDGSGSIRDFRTKMWSTQQKEAADHWVAYEWNESGSEKASTSLQRLLVEGDKRVELECKTRPLDYLDKA